MAKANPIPQLPDCSTSQFPCRCVSILCASFAVAVCVTGTTGCSNKREIPEINPPIVLSSQKKPKKTPAKSDAKPTPGGVADNQPGGNQKKPNTPGQQTTTPASVASKTTTKRPEVAPAPNSGTVAISVNTVPAKIVVSETTGVQPLSEIGEWTGLPQFLKTATAYQRIRRNAGLKINESEFTVEQPGVVVILASWSNDGSLEGGWFPTRTTANKLERGGWTLLGKATLTDRRDIPHKHSIYARNFNAGEKFKFHTRKINPPIVVAFDTGLLKAALGGGTTTPVKPAAPQKGVAGKNTVPRNPATTAVTPQPALTFQMQTTNLLKHIDPARDAVDGEWKLDAGALLSPERPSAKLRVAEQVPEEYDLRLTVERQSGKGALYVGAPVDGRQVPCYIDVSFGLPAPYTGIGTNNGQGPNLRSNSFKGEILRTKSPIDVEIAVRKGSVAIKIGTNVVFEWNGDSSPFQIPPAWTIPQKQALYLGAARSTFRISRIEVINPKVGLPKQAEIQRLAIPDAAAQKKSLALLKDVFRKELANAKTAEQQLALAGKLLEQAGRSEQDPAGQFVLMREARMLAAKAGKTEVALKIVDSMAAKYDIEIFAEKLDALRRVSQSSEVKNHQADLATAALGVARSSLNAAHYGPSLELVKLANAAAAKTRKRELIDEISGFRRKLMILKKWEAEAAKAAKLLATRPDNPKANLERGRYLCFLKQDWPGGLRMLVKGDDADLKAVALLDLAAPGGEKQIVVVGNAWWDLSRKQSASSFLRTLYQSRAAYWYRQVASRLTGLRKTQVENRLKEIEAK